jgi:hypothetical protein
LLNRHVRSLEHLANQLRFHESTPMYVTVPLPSDRVTAAGRPA